MSPPELRPSVACGTGAGPSGQSAVILSAAKGPPEEIILSSSIVRLWVSSEPGGPFETIPDLWREVSYGRRAAGLVTALCLPVTPGLSVETGRDAWPARYVVYAAALAGRLQSVLCYGGDARARYAGRHLGSIRVLAPPGSGTSANACRLLCDLLASPLRAIVTQVVVSEKL